MKEPIRKTAAFLLIWVMLYNLAGYQLVFEYGRYAARREMAAFLKKNQEQLQWIEVQQPESNPEFFRIHRTEILLCGKLYDIVKEEKVGHITRFLCIHDRHEEKTLKAHHKTETEKKRHLLADHSIKIALKQPKITVFPGEGHEMKYSEIEAPFLIVPIFPPSPPPEVG
ncbi:MAG: hypothetical protein FJY10_06610 [Bacteroidetes bacterium]|nr:hypothetical protein [Bacteroidota bacterium]